MLIAKWSGKDLDNELTDFVQLWEDADKTKYSDEVSYTFIHEI